MTKRKDTKGRLLRDNEYQKSDGRYEFRYQDQTGKRQSIYSWRLVETDHTPSGKRECESLRKMEQTIRRDLEDGIIFQRDVGLNDLWDKYISQRTELKKSTADGYKYYYNKYIREEIGYQNISGIKYSAMRNFFSALIVDKGFKPNTIKNIYKLIHPVFELAIRDGYIRLNPLDGIMTDLKKGRDWTTEKRHALTEQQQSIFFSYVAGHSTFREWLPLLTCLIGTGCRIGEMLGLRWQDIDWQNGTISINHNLTYRYTDTGHYEFHITSTKTQSGVREIPMFEDVRNALIQQRKSQVENGGCKDTIDGYSNFVWQNEAGNLQNPFAVNRALDKIIKTYNAEETDRAEREHREPVLLPHFSCHNLRHTFCTRLCENERDIKIIQEIMGHADISTTMDIYNESNLDRKKASFARLEGLIKIS